MSKLNSLWQEAKQDALDAYFSGAAGEEEARARLRQLGLDCEEAENELHAVEEAHWCPDCSALVDDDGYSIDERACFYCRAD